MAAGASMNTRPLEETPTWSVAVVLTIYVLASVIAERGLHHLGLWLKKTKRKPLYETLEKIKEELMLLGFISLILTVTAEQVSKLCVKTSFYDKQPVSCKKRRATAAPMPGPAPTTGHRRRLLEYILTDPVRRSLAVSNDITCPEGKETFISFLSLEQLHRFIFIMAITHILYICMTMLLAIVKVRRWRLWEQEARSNSPANLAELTRNLTVQRQSTFVMYHTSRPWSRNRLFVWLVCFFRQFGQTVTKADYLALRMGFIRIHHTGDNYDFHSYMIRSMEDEFKDILILLVGAKLQHVIATLALESAGIQGRYDPQIRPRDDLFWLNRPQMMLSLIHFILFQNSFELATFLWALWQFGTRHCFLRKHYLVYGRLISGLVVQVFCSYSTLPLYALVTQMGSTYKKAIFKEGVLESLHGWRKKAHKKAKLGEVHEGSTGASPEGLNGGSSNTPMDERILEDAGGWDEIKVELEDSQGSSHDTFRNQSMPILRYLPSSPRAMMEIGRSGTTRN
ncbi:hypothetical protein O6H91_04G140000 [Diphasiastrum complanatum]|uniref:Uncharacterized protein n=1 Tax=Diphasiastrum complanatum TaxID=34168 RepID=A0ACC2E2T8_DIPCM|nr:hypothetical protein O6H91_04G140000 [Diphasiastrum complanatum]